MVGGSMLEEKEKDDMGEIIKLFLSLNIHSS